MYAFNTYYLYLYSKQMHIEKEKVEKKQTSKQEKIKNATTDQQKTSIHFHNAEQFLHKVL